MPYKFSLSSLDVGQGMCTFFECYNDQLELAHIALFDVGSTKNSNDTSLDFVVGRIKARSPPNGYLDIVFLSHKDADHTNLVITLLGKVPNASIGMVRYGGKYEWYEVWDKKAGEFINILSKLGERTRVFDQHVKGFPVGNSDYDPQTGKFGLPVWPGTDFNFYLLCANAPYRDEEPGTSETNMSERPDGDQANSKSLVIALNMGFTWAIIGGDATYSTFLYVNSFLFNDKFPIDVPFPNNIMTLLPHHGSRRTTFGLDKTSAQISQAVREVVQSYAGLLGGATIVASADTSHSHPSLETIDVFLEYTDQKTGWWSDSGLDRKHYLTAYIDPEFAAENEIPSGYATFQTDGNVYSTRYYLQLTAPTFSYPSFEKPAPAPKPGHIFAPGMNWTYECYSNSPATTLSGWDSRRLDAAPPMPLPAPPREAVRPPPARPIAGATTSVRRPGSGAARAAVAPPRAASALSRLVSVL